MRWPRPIRARRARAEMRRRAERWAEYDAYIAGLPRFDHPPPGLDPEAFAARLIDSGGRASWTLDTTVVPDGHYEFDLPLQDAYGQTARAPQHIVITNGAPRPGGS